MTDIQSRPFSKNYSGLINQSVLATGVAVFCVACHEILKRKKRGKVLHDEPPGLGSRESWECGYLYQARSWTRVPSPPLPSGWPLSWVRPAIAFPEDKLRQLRGIDATIYIRFLRGCFWFALMHLLTTFPILFAIHFDFSDASVPSKSMIRASISSLVGTAQGRSLLWIHICILFWLDFSWIAMLLWICDGAFKMRAANIEDSAAQNGHLRNLHADEANSKIYHPHPHPQYSFTDIPSNQRERPVSGLRLRTIMVTNIPHALRTEKDIKDYFEYYMSHKVGKPIVGITSSSQPGFIDKSLAFLLNRAKRTYESEYTSDNPARPLIERVVIARKMNELSSLLQRREETLVNLEAAHIRLASKVLTATKTALEKNCFDLGALGPSNEQKSHADAEQGMAETGMEQLVEVLRPCLEEFKKTALKPNSSFNLFSRRGFHKLKNRSPSGDHGDSTGSLSSSSPTVWDGLLSLPRSALDAYQPLIHLNRFSGKVVPAIDYYTTKFNLLSALITENRAKPPSEFNPTSTAFVTFDDPTEARRACKNLAVHPKNPLACQVTMAPLYSDIDWNRMMKSSLRAEFVKDWVISLVVWAFTIFWIFPISLLVGLVSIQNVSLLWPSLKQYLDRHPDKSEALESLIPTLLVSLLSLLIPPILLLIAKKIHLVTTISSLHDMLLTRYYKFLVVNFLVFFCIGTAAMQSLLQSLTSGGQNNLIQIVADSFPTAGPFYVGWLIFCTALHGGIELSMLGVPLIRHCCCRRQTIPRKRLRYLRPARPNFYYWFPNHCLVLHVLLLFSVLNPFVLPFGMLYFFVQTGVIKHQLIHVYSKSFEGDGKILLIRIIRYSLDGLVLSQAIFLAYMVVLHKLVNVGLAAFLIVFTVVVKMTLTRMCRAQFELDDAAEADVICNGLSRRPTRNQHGSTEGFASVRDTQRGRYNTYAPRLPKWINFSYSNFDGNHGIRRHKPQQHRPNPFGPHRKSDSTSSLVEGTSTYQEARNSAVLNAGQPYISTKYISLHPALVPWDDQHHADLPYDNPFYARAIGDKLWLPRNPLALLNLDDTVDLRVSITTDQSTGHLGSWIAPNAATDVSDSPIPTPTRPGVGYPSSGIHLPVNVENFNGREDIALPTVIAQRVEAGDTDIEQPARTSRIFPRRMYSGDDSARRNARSSSTLRLENRSRSNSTPQVTSISNMEKGTVEQSLRPDPRTLSDVVASNPSASRMSLSLRPGLPRPQVISSAQAIFHEILEEERDAFNERVEEEIAEVEAELRTGKSWFSWLYSKPH